MDNPKFDIAGTAISLACLAHCLALPLLSSFAPSLTVYLGQEWIHLGLLVLLVPIAMFAFVKGKKRHNRVMPLLVAVIGIVFLFSALMFEDFEAMPLEQILTVAGSLTLVVAHIKNILLTRKLA